MQIILLEKIANLGNLGDVVKVKDGYARNFLIPGKHARRATEAAIKEFEDAPRRTGKGRCREAGRRAGAAASSWRARSCASARRPVSTAACSAR